MKTFPQSKLLMAAGVVAFASVATPALAQSFTVQEGAIPGATPNLVNADRISFNYAATIVQSGAVGSPGNSFTESGFLTKASFANGGSAVASQLNGLAPGGYGIYGLFTVGGSAAPNGAGGITATFTSLTLDLWADPSQNTTTGFSGTNASSPAVVPKTPCWPPTRWCRVRARRTCSQGSPTVTSIPC